MAKTYAATYLYSQYSEYEKQIFSFIMSGTELDKDSPDFDDIKYNVKMRRVSSGIVKLLSEKDVVLMVNDTPLSKAFKVFCAKDIKGPDKKRMKVFIDCSNIIKKDPKSGRYVCDQIDVFISYLVAATTTLIYYSDENRITMNSKIMSVGATAFAKLFTNVVDYVCKISSMPSYKNKCMYLASLYYLGNILGKDYTTDSCRRIAKKVSGLSDREAGVVDIQIKQESFMNVKYFVETVASVLHISKLTLDIVVERWMSAFGTGTVFALEIFPAFAAMITDAYVGAYVNSQKAIQKIIDTSMTEFTKVLLSIGDDSL